MVHQHHARGPQNVVGDYPETVELRNKHPDKFPNQPPVSEYRKTYGIGENPSGLVDECDGAKRNYIHNKH